MRVVATLAVAAVCFLLLPEAAAQDIKARSRAPGVRISLVDANTGVTSIHPGSGWQLTALLEVKKGHLLGIGIANFPPTFPDEGRTGYLVFDDPDQCPSFVFPGPQVDAYVNVHCLGTADGFFPDCEPVYWPDDPAWPLGGQVCPPEDDEGRLAWENAVIAAGLAWPKDETWVEFTPGLSGPDPIPTLTIEGFEEDEPELWVGAAGDWQRWPYGPDLGSTEDDVRYGAWDRLPGLVVVADHGPGVRWVPPGDTDVAPAPDFFDRLQPAEAWNLAGFFSSAAYSLKGGVTATSILAHLNVPRQLFTPVVLVDKEISYPVDVDGVLCGEDDALYRMDGGPLTCSVGGLGHTDLVVNDTVVTVRVFVVDGDAPDVLVDRDWDGDVDIQDARLMGLKPVTSEAVTRFTQYHELECGFPFDFDGDGNPGGCVLPARPGGLTRPPR